jgi:hypothetical protein
VSSLGVYVQKSNYYGILCQIVGLFPVLKQVYSRCGWKNQNVKLTSLRLGLTGLRIDGVGSSACLGAEYVQVRGFIVFEAEKCLISTTKENCCGLKEVE